MAGNLVRLCSYDETDSEEEDEAEDKRDQPKPPKRKLEEDTSKDAPSTDSQFAEPPGKSSRLPVPGDIVGMFPTSTSKGNSDSHQGRSRAFPHVRGNWASHLYISYHQDLESLQESIIPIVSELLSLDAHPIDSTECHVSLSKVNSRIRRG
jgi:hypothetical protein